jgi:2-polyprenyl-3-methyl-5-hydroxy-6-metoxy-1,4-benzoquinol methylase
VNDTERNFLEKNLALFCCPRCSADLELGQGQLHCAQCQNDYPCNTDIPSLYWQNEWGNAKVDVTDRMKSFYEANPFPNYDEFDDAGSLMDKARKGLFAKSLDDQIPFGTRVLECGCGTGQLTNFLAIANRTVIGADICLNSLKMAHGFKEKNKLDRAHFYQMNLFRPCFKPQTFDFVISNGVLHHTSDPRLAFASIAKLVKPNGYLIVGLYHKYGRLFTDFRRVVFNLTRDRMKFLDSRLLNASISSAKKKSWFMDQYKNPHESKHTVGEVLEWLAPNDLTFVNSLPKTVPFKPFNESEDLFTPDRLGNKFERFCVDLGMISSGHREGGFFIVIARKQARQPSDQPQPSVSTARPTN